MACPSDPAYVEVLRTVSGLTPAAPYTLVANEFAYGEWHALVDSLLFRVHSDFKDYTVAKPAESWTDSENEKWARLRDELFSLDQELVDLPGPQGIFISGGLSIADELQAMVALAEATACLWQTVNETAATMGVETKGPGDRPVPAPGLADRTMGLLEKVVTVVAIVGGGAVLVYGIRAFQNRKGQ
jgi:hypothetical protein